MSEHECITHMGIIAIKQNIDSIQLVWVSLYHCIKYSLHIQVMDWQSCFSELVFFFSLLPSASAAAMFAFPPHCYLYILHLLPLPAQPQSLWLS